MKLKKHLYMLAALSALSACNPDLLRVPTKEDDCRRQAHERIKLYNKPDIYPISEEEQQEALNSLFNACMSGNTYQKESNTSSQPGQIPPPPPPPDAAITETNEPPLEPPFQDSTSSRSQLENILTH